MQNQRLNDLRLLLLAGGCSLGISAQAYDAGIDNTDWNFGGHGKYQYINTSIPENSVLQEAGGDVLQDHNLEFRLKASARRGHWEFNTHAQLIKVHSDSLAVFAGLPGSIYPGADVMNDDRRWFNLTHEISYKNKNATLVRLDRFNLSYTGQKTVVRFGRQAISWGNGLMFTPMDILNPFDPTAVDREYKTGDDMLYTQYLFDNGNDLQAAVVVRRDPFTGDTDSGQSSLALKIHGFWPGGEFDLLAAQHYGKTLLGLGLSGDMGEAIWRGDLVFNDTDSGAVYSAVGGLSYSWLGFGHNWTGLLEYYFNGFGQPDSDFSPGEISVNTDLLRRLTRGELYNIGRHYVGASVMLEATPLFNLTSNTFINLADPSALAQLVITYDWKQDIQLLAALNFPIGPDGTEYGGPDAGEPGLYLSTGPSLFAQLAWYF